MSWSIAVVIVAAFAATVTGLQVCLPYLRKRSDAETRLAALEAANVELGDRMARVEQVMEAGSPLSRLPRAGMSR